MRVNKGKFAKDRMTPLGRKACDYVREYLQKVRAEWSKSNRDERALWLSSKQPHGPLKSQAIEVMVKQYGRDAGIEKRVTPHVWRHTCATHLVADGANIAYVQRLLGHRSLRTTQIYTRTTVAEIKATHAKAHPEARSQGPQPATFTSPPSARRANRCCIERPTMKLDELLHRFQGDLQIRNYSARTVTDYGYNLGLLFQFLDQRQITDIQSVTQRHAGRLPTLGLLPADQAGDTQGRAQPKRHPGRRQKLLPVPESRRLPGHRSRRGHRVCPRAAQPAPERPHAPGGQAHH